MWLDASHDGHVIHQESVELPLTHPEYYEEMGIKPPKGVILYGAPGTGYYNTVGRGISEGKFLQNSDRLQKLISKCLVLYLCSHLTSLALLQPKCKYNEFLKCLPSEISCYKLCQMSTVVITCCVQVKRYWLKLWPIKRQLHFYVFVDQN